MELDLVARCLVEIVKILALVKALLELMVTSCILIAVHENGNFLIIKNKSCFLK